MPLNAVGNFKIIVKIGVKVTQVPGSENQILVIFYANDFPQELDNYFIRILFRTIDKESTM